MWQPRKILTKTEIALGKGFDMPKPAQVAPRGMSASPRKTQWPDFQHSLHAQNMNWLIIIQPQDYLFLYGSGS